MIEASGLIHQLVMEFFYSPKYNWSYFSEKTELNDRKVFTPRGKVIGDLVQLMQWLYRGANLIMMIGLNLFLRNGIINLY